MTVMRKPKKASSFLRPVGKYDKVGEQRDKATSKTKEQGLQVHTIFIQKEEHKSVCDGDENPCPEWNPDRGEETGYNHLNL